MRQPIVIVVSGAKGTGKSTFVADQVLNEPGNAIVLKHASNIDDKAFSFLTEKTMSNWRQGASAYTPVKCKFSAVTKKDYATFIDWVYKGNFSNGLLVIDDTVLFERGRTSDTFLNLLTMGRHFKIDIIIVYHGMTHIPIDTFTFINYLVLFNTTDNFWYKKDRVPKFDQLLQAHEQVKRNRMNEDTFYTPVIVDMSV